MEVNPGAEGGVDVRLSKQDVRRLRTALQRALFEDVPPHHVGPALDFADRLLKELDAAEASDRPPEGGGGATGAGGSA